MSRSISEALKAFSAEATCKAFCTFTREPQWGHVRVFWSTAAISKPPQQLHTMISVTPMACPFPKDFSTNE